MQTHAPFQPVDDNDRQLLQQVHPESWQNPTPRQPYQLVVIGAGTAGLVTAAGAAGLGARVALIERDLMGGDCLNVGCVPSKALLAAARVAATVRRAPSFGVQVEGEPPVDFSAVMHRMRQLRAKISPMDSARRFQELGVDVYFGEARFGDDQTVLLKTASDETPLRFRRAVVATGARAAAPPIPGLDQVEYLTNETLFSLQQRPDHLAIIGAGPIGVEMAQAFARFGSRVTVIEAAERILPRDDPEAARRVADQLTRDGVQCLLSSRDLQISAGASGAIQLQGQAEERPFGIQADQLLVAAGRAPNTESLQLEAAGIEHDSRGITVNDRLQTSNRRVYAAGDVASDQKFTHAADFQARTVIQNALFRIGPFGAARASQLIIPWTTYTAPEVAQVGPTPAELESGPAVDTWYQPLEENDRAVLEGATAGFVKIHTRRGSDRIVSATIVGPHAGDLISEVTLAMQHGIGLSKLARTIHPYPTLADAIRRLGDHYNRSRLTPRTKKLLGLLRWFNVGR